MKTNKTAQIASQNDGRQESLSDALGHLLVVWAGQGTEFLLLWQSLP